MSRKSKSSKRWLKEHFSDIYVKRAKQEGLRARSVYKLVEIVERYGIIKPDMLVVDLGSAPGGWSEYVAKIVGSKGRVFALDILPMQPLDGVEFIQGDFTQDIVVQGLVERLSKRKVDVVLSDLASNLSGFSIVDQARSITLVEQALMFAKRVLKPCGTFLTKVFQGAEINDFLKDLRCVFAQIKVVKPEASRARSKEVFLLAREFRQDISD